MKRAAPACEFHQPIQRDLGGPAARANIIRFAAPRLGSYFRTVSSRQEGRIAIVTNARRDVVDAAASDASVIAGRLVRERSNGAQDERR
jgi:hypothetical protein